VAHRDAWEVAELHGLVREREDPADEGLRGDRGGEGGEADEHVRRHAGRDHREERVRDRRRIAEDERALAQVRERERGQNEEEPRDADGAGPEVPHVGIEGLAARDGEHDDPEDGEPAEAVVDEVERAPVRREGAHDLGGLHELLQAEDADGDEPRHHDGPEDLAHVARAALLDREEANEDEAGQRHDVRLETGRGELEALEGAQDRDGGRDHAVAEEERGAGDHEERDDADTRLRVAAREEREEREDPPFTAVVGAHDERDVLDRHGEDERPQDERDDAEEVGVAEGRALRVGRDLEGVEGARPDIAEDDADGGGRGGEEGGFVAGRVWGGGSGAPVHGRVVSRNEVAPQPPPEAYASGERRIRSAT
jgi:hypothetical protein